VINEILHFLRLLFNSQWISDKPDRPLKQQCIHNPFDQIIRLQSNDIGNVLISGRFLLVRPFPALQIPNLKPTAATHNGNFALQSNFPAKLFGQNETSLSICGSMLRTRVQLT
jgi:hypothetical protein